MDTPTIKTLLAAVAQFGQAFETIQDLLPQAVGEAEQIHMDLEVASQHILDEVTLDRVKHEEDIAFEDYMSLDRAMNLWFEINHRLDGILCSIAYEVETAAETPLPYDEWKAFADAEDERLRKLREADANEQLARSGWKPTPAPHVNYFSIFEKH